MVGRFVPVQYGNGTGLLYLKLEQCYCQGERICENAGGLMIMNVRYLDLRCVFIIQTTSIDESVPCLS